MVEPFKKLTLAQVEEDFARIAREVPPEMVGVVQRKIGFDVLAGVIKRTPVDTGRAKGAWTVSVGGQNSGSSAPDKSPQGNFAGPTFSRGNLLIVKAPPFSFINISNNVTYIIVLDQGGFIPPDPGPSKDPRPERRGKILVQRGYSIQAPSGMVDVTLAEIMGKS